MMDSVTYDVIIVGGGHNGLTTAGYLARKGLRVKVLERRDVVGGAVVTEEFHPGFRNSVCAYTVSLLNSKVVTDLELARYGLEVITRPVSNFVPFEDGRYLMAHPEHAALRAEIAKFSAKDAAALADYERVLGRLADVLRGLVLETPPNIGGGLGAMLNAYRATRHFKSLGLEGQQELADLMSMSAVDFLERWFESDQVKTLFAFDGVVGTMASPYQPGTAYVLLHHCFGEVNGKQGAWGHAIGGMGSITQAMARSAEAHGAEIETGTPVAEVLVENGRAVGVRLEDGRTLRARAVAANVSPKLLFSQLVDASHVDPEFRERITGRRYQSGTFRMNVALSELPDFRCLPGTAQGQHHTAGIIMAPSLQYMEQAYLDARRDGWSRRPIVEMLIPSTIDSTLAPEGQHVASLFCQHFNPDLPDGRSWDEVRDQVADTIIDTVTEFAPNFRAAVLGRQLLSPLDLEREFGLLGGDIFHGSLDTNQLFSLRPTIGAADYKMPVGGLYLCGSGAHPGGGVTGAPGHNAAREILKDFRRPFGRVRR